MGLPRDQWLPLSFDALRSKNLSLFRKLNAVIFPLTYTDKFYADCMAAGKVTQLGAPCPPPAHQSVSSSTFPLTCSLANPSPKTPPSG